VVGVPVRRGAVIGCDQELVVGNDARCTANHVVVRDEQHVFGEPTPKLLADELVDALARDGNAEQEEAHQHRELVGLAEPSQVCGQLGRPCEELVAGCETLLDVLRVVARCAEEPSQFDSAAPIRAWRIRSHVSRSSCSP
jgi:hypothetical protein